MFMFVEMSNTHWHINYSTQKQVTQAGGSTNVFQGKNKQTIKKPHKVDMQSMI